ncbi:hypothetical protein DPF_0380 [Desulfoplanes formicivorans]|uniref:Uncharacterized protein n=1 Tax=Desulfoplanes formicivorans TaxID=1592317 RepID=A0A194AER7_9BACT|nr:hypothetical protein DPF_0380 [Desulfoplanes formicivorans]
MNDLQVINTFGQTRLGRMKKTQVSADTSPDADVGDKKIVHEGTPVTMKTNDARGARRTNRSGFKAFPDQD